MRRMKIKCCAQSKNGVCKGINKEMEETKCILAGLPDQKPHDMRYRCMSQRGIWYHLPAATRSRH
jgi:hypothetical protein